MDVYRVFEEKINRELEAVLDEPDHYEIAPETLRCITEAAEGGDLESQKCLMMLYQFGEGDIEEDEEEYAYLAERAAENGDSEAMCKIGNMYLALNGIQCDLKVIWNKITLQDEKDKAQAQLYMAQANKINKEVES